MTRNESGESSIRADDTFDDAAAAYREVAEKAGVQVSDKLPPARVSSDGEPSGDVKTVSEKPRDTGGRFAPKGKSEEIDPATKTAADPTDDKTKAGAQATADTKTVKEAAADAPVTAAGPPTSWSVKAKAAWDRLPDEVRADIAKREGEMANGLAALRDYKDLKPYAEMAAKAGTTINKALERYVGFDKALDTNLPQGLAIIAQNKGLTQEKFAALCAQMAESYSGGKIKMAGAGSAPNAAGAAPHAGAPADPLVEALRPVLGPLVEKINALEGQHTSRTKAEQAAQANTLGQAITKFSADPANRYFTELEETMTRLMETGMVPMTGNHLSDLKTAYETAAQMHPDVREALIEQRLTEKLEAGRRKEQEAADKARSASRSLTGSRTPGMKVVDQQPGRPGQDDVEADVRAAYRAVAGR